MLKISGDIISTLISTSNTKDLYHSHSKQSPKKWLAPASVLLSLQTIFSAPVQALFSGQYKALSIALVLSSNLHLRQQVARWAICNGDWPDNDEPPCYWLPPHVHEFKKTHGTHRKAIPSLSPSPSLLLLLTMGGDRPLLSVTRLTFLTERNVFRSIASHSWTWKLSFSTHSNEKIPLARTPLRVLS